LFDTILVSLSFLEDWELFINVCSKLGRGFMSEEDVDPDLEGIKRTGT